MLKWYFLVFLFLNLVIGVVIAAPTTINSCQTINSSGSYILTQDISGASIQNSDMGGKACIVIAASNTTVDCANFTIINNITSDTTGGIVNDNQNNLIIKNCKVSGYTFGIYFYSSKYSAIINSVADSSSGYSIDFDKSSNNIIMNTNARSTYGQGIYLGSSSNNSLINTTITGAYGGLTLDIASNNSITNSTVNSTSGPGIYLSSSSNNNLINTAIKVISLGSFAGIHFHQVQIIT